MWARSILHFSIQSALSRLTSHHNKIYHSISYLICYLSDFYLFICIFHVGEIYSFFKIYGALIRLTACYIKLQHSAYNLICYLSILYLFICKLNVGDTQSSFFDLQSACTAFHSSYRIHHSIQYLSHLLLTFYLLSAIYSAFFRKFQGRVGRKLLSERREPILDLCHYLCQTVT